MTSPNLLKIYKWSKMYGWHAYAVNKILKYASQSKATDYWVLKCMLVLSHTQLFATPWTIALESPLSMGFPRQEYWSGLPFPPLGDLPNPGIEPMSSEFPVLQADSLLAEPLGKPRQANWPWRIWKGPVGRKQWQTWRVRPSWVSWQLSFFFHYPMLSQA